LFPTGTAKHANVELGHGVVFSGIPSLPDIVGVGSQFAKGADFVEKGLQ
jgi:hypothetical protein